MDTSVIEFRVESVPLSAAGCCVIAQDDTISMLIDKISDMITFNADPGYCCTVEFPGNVYVNCHISDTFDVAVYKTKEGAAEFEELVISKFAEAIKDVIPELSKCMLELVE